MSPVASLPRAAMHKSILKAARTEEADSLPRLVDLIEQDYQFKLGYLVVASMIQSAEVSIDVIPPERMTGSPDRRDEATFPDENFNPSSDGEVSTDDREPSDLTRSIRGNVGVRVAGDPFPRWGARENSRAERLTDNLKAVWAQSLPHAVRSFAYGRAAFERTYSFEAESMLHLVAGLDYLPPEYTDLVLDEDGRFAGVKLAVGGEEVVLDPARSWWFALDPSATEPHGRSRYLGAPYQVWQARKQLAQEERIWYAKFAVGHGVARAPEKQNPPAPYEGHAPDPGNEDADPMEVLRRELASIESGGTLILSSQTYPDGRYLYDYQESVGHRDGTPLEQRRRMLDSAALRSLGIPERAIIQDSDTGSRAAAQVYLDVLHRTCEGVLDQIATSFERYVVRKAVEVNWPVESRPTMRLKHSGIGRGGNQGKPSIADLAREVLRGQTLESIRADGRIDLDRWLATTGIPLRPRESAIGRA